MSPMSSAGRAPTLFYTLAFALQLRKITENLSQGSRNISSDPASPLLGGSGSKLGQRKCLPNCRTSGSPTSANLVSNLSVRDPI